MHILGDEENKSCKKSWVLSLFKCIGILVGQQTSSTAAVGSLDFADNSLSGEKKETSIFRFLFRINNNKTTSTEILSTINIRSDDGLMLEMSALKLFTVANLRYQLS